MRRGHHNCIHSSAIHYDVSGHRGQPQPLGLFHDLFQPVARGAGKIRLGQRLNAVALDFAQKLVEAVLLGLARLLLALQAASGAVLA